MSLNTLRAQIDAIDRSIVVLLEKRAATALKVKRLTKDGSTPIRAERERAIIDKVVEQSKTLDEQFITSIYTEIISASRALQNKRELTIATLGPEGTYSEEATTKLFGSHVNKIFADSISEALSLCENDVVDMVVAPLENSSEGVVRESHSFLYDTSLLISAELWLPISHNLLTEASDLKKIKKVYAHPQALGQCRHWLTKNLPHAKQISRASTAEAAQKVMGKKDAAAIASKYAGEIYKLPVMHKSINDQETNRTRFIALSKNPTHATGKDKTSIIAVVHEKPGALFDLLKILRDANITMTRLESQPYHGDQYAFFIDFIGHVDDKKVSDSMKKLKKEAAQILYLGSYRRAGK